MSRTFTENKLERDFQAALIKELREIFPGCFILKNDAGYLQGIPDLTVLYRKHWAILECKAAANSDHQPNQDYYVDVLDDMSYAAFIYPENKEDIINELRKAFGSRR